MWFWIRLIIKKSLSDIISIYYIWIAAQTPDTLSICPHVTKDRDFAIIGHAGGDPYRGCENTLEATRIALARSLSSTLKNQNRTQQNSSKGSVIYLKRSILVHWITLLQKVYLNSNFFLYHQTKNCSVQWCKSSKKLEHIVPSSSIREFNRARLKYF